jgi:hypothetical protein
MTQCFSLWVENALLQSDGLSIEGIASLSAGQLVCLGVEPFAGCCLAHPYKHPNSFCVAICPAYVRVVGRDSSVGIATRYGLDGPGIESRWGRDFPHPSRWVPPSLLYNGYRVSFPGVKRPGRGVVHPPSSSAGVKERVELYLYSPSGPSWSLLGRTLFMCVLILNVLIIVYIVMKLHSW